MWAAPRASAHGLDTRGRPLSIYSRRRNYFAWFIEDSPLVGCYNSAWALSLLRGSGAEARYQIKWMTRNAEPRREIFSVFQYASHPFTLFHPRACFRVASYCAPRALGHGFCPLFPPRGNYYTRADFGRAFLLAAAACPVSLATRRSLAPLKIYAYIYNVWLNAEEAPRVLGKNKWTASRALAAAITSKEGNWARQLIFRKRHSAPGKTVALFGRCAVVNANILGIIMRIQSQVACASDGWTGKEGERAESTQHRPRLTARSAAAEIELVLN